MSQTIAPMILHLVLLLTSYGLIEGSFITLGCYNFNSKNFVVQGTFTNDTVNSCFNEALKQQHNYFAVSSSNCYTDANKITFISSTPSPSTFCRDGTGFAGSYDVYGVVTNGNWNTWSVWSACSSSCNNGGTRMSQRLCNNPPSSEYGKQCVTTNGNRSSYEIKVENCNINVTCGATCKARTTQGQCCVPFTHNGTNHDECRLDNVSNTLTCVFNGTNKSCVRRAYGVWNAWGVWSLCSSRCTGGKRMRLRTCQPSAINQGNLHCLNNQTQKVSSYEVVEEQCNQAIKCPVNGGWSVWRKITACTRTCGGGSNREFRQCNNPFAKDGGLLCKTEGKDNKLAMIEQRVARCNDVPCPIKGGFGQWGNWSACNSTCKGGSRIRQRQCDNPIPQHGGAGCIVADATQTESCNTNIPCPPSWAMWGPWSACSATCKGVRTKSRTCTNPPPTPPQAGCVVGNQTLLHHNMTEKCNDIPCPINGNWGVWGNWGACSSTCKGASRSRERHCNNPPAQHGGLNCLVINTNNRLKKLVSVELCNNNITCPANWNTWSQWTTCSTTCGAGVRTKSRTCTNPPPVTNGTACVLGNQTSLHHKMTEDCNHHISCVQPIVATWTVWGVWGECDYSCNSKQFVRRKSRNCTAATSTDYLPGFICDKGSTGNTTIGKYMEEPCTNTRIDNTRNICPIEIAYIIGGAVAGCCLLLFLVFMVISFLCSRRRMGSANITDTSGKKGARMKELSIKRPPKESKKKKGGKGESPAPGEPVVVYAELGEGGGRQGKQPQGKQPEQRNTKKQAEQSNYAKVKTDGVDYPALDNIGYGSYDRYLSIEIGREASSDSRRPSAYGDIDYSDI